VNTAHALVSRDDNCPGPLIWFDVDGDEGRGPDAVLECATCGHFTVTGQPLDTAHALAPLLREGMATA
jgi:hypothetical protein